MNCWPWNLFFGVNNNNAYLSLSKNEKCLNLCAIPYFYESFFSEQCWIFVRRIYFWFFVTFWLFSGVMHAFAGQCSWHKKQLLVQVFFGKQHPARSAGQVWSVKIAHNAWRCRFAPDKIFSGFLVRQRIRSKVKTFSVDTSFCFCLLFWIGKTSGWLSCYHFYYFDLVALAQQKIRTLSPFLSSKCELVEQPAVIPPWLCIGVTACFFGAWYQSRLPCLPQKAVFFHKNKFIHIL